MSDNQTTNTLYKRICDDIISAKKSGDKVRALSLSTLKGELQRISDGKPENLTDDQIVKNIQKSIKGIEETIQITKQHTPDDESIETKLEVEHKILSEFLPRMMEEDEVRAAVEKAISDTGATIKKDMGKVMGKLKQYGSAMDMNVASKLVRDLLK